MGNVEFDYKYFTKTDSDNMDNNLKYLYDYVKSEGNMYDLLLSRSDYETLYYFSPIRQNILEWFDFNPGADLLEIGAECGALTGMFCDRVKNVVAVESSESKCLINASRNTKKDNLKFILGRFLEMEEIGTYDYVTLIGCSNQVKSESELKLVCNKIAELLKPGGQFILAIDNQYGVKNWNLMSDKAVSVVFSKQTIENCFNNSGFHHIEYYYPQPDYIFANEIYSQYNLPQKGDIRNGNYKYDVESYRLLNEDYVNDVICEQDVFPLFANSYLIIGSLGESDEENDIC